MTVHRDHVPLPGAEAFLEHRDAKGNLLWSGTFHNLVTTAGRDFLHTQGYATSGIGANGFNYIGLSNDASAPAVGDTVLASEIVANGLSRAQGTVAHTGGTNTTTVSKTFTCTTTSQAAQKLALFTASSSGTMCHEIAFPQRTLQVGDTLAVTVTVTLG